MFIATPLHANLSAWADRTLQTYGGSDAIYMIYAVVIIAVLLLGVMCHNALRFLLYLSWALYLPPILSFSRFDLLSSVIDGGTGVTGRRAPAGTRARGRPAAGLRHAGTGRRGRAPVPAEELLERGAGREEVDTAIRGSLKYVAMALAASALLTAMVSVATTGLAYFGESVAPSGTYWYLLLAVAGGAVIAFILMFLLRQGRPENRMPESLVEIFMFRTLAGI